MLKTLRARLPEGMELSITALPCHLKHRVFRELQGSIDYFVLQVHGNEIPRKIGDPRFRLFDLKSAKLAVREALALADATGSQCVVALPTYAYRLIFDAADGRLQRVEAEVNKGGETGKNSRILAAKMAERVLGIQLFKKPKISPVDNPRKLKWVEYQLKKELQEAEAWFEELTANEKAWVAADLNVTKKYREVYKETPKVRVAK